VKVCNYCGKENPDESSHCAGCGCELPLAPEPVAPPVLTPDFKPIKIKTSDLLGYCLLEVSPKGVAYTNGSLSIARKMGFHQIALVLLSADHVLSFQVDQEIFKIQTKANDPKHQELICRLVEQVNQSRT
jgi:hypothetical protein